MVFGYKSFWTFGLLIGCQILSSSATDSVPILLWDDHGKTSSFTPFNPLHTTDQLEFMEIMNKKLENLSPPLLIFIKDSFCSEDFRQNKEASMILRNGSFLYRSAVKKPLSFLENLPSYEQLKKEELESIGENQLAIIQVKNVDEALKKYKDVRETSPNLVTILTGNYCTYNQERVRRAAQVEVEASNETVLFFNDTKGGSSVLFYSSQFPTIKKNDSSEQMTSLSTASTVKRDNSSIIVLLTFSTSSTPKIVTSFNFSLSGGYYTLKSVLYSDSNLTNEPLFFKNQIYLPQDFSYHCGHDVIFKNNSLVLNFADLQVQLDAKKAFGDAYDCVGFTTIPIWSGIFVTIILGIIMIWGLTMIIDIHTMDRFDDPKGKTITISAQD